MIHRAAGPLMINLLKATILCFSMGVMVSCSAVYRNHGFTPLDADLAKIVIGVDTRASVEETLGAPTTSGIKTLDGFYYISSRWRYFGTKAPAPTDREVVVVSFTTNNLVKNISRYGLKDAKVIVLSRRVTEGGSGEISLIRQLMGNFGRVSAEDMLLGV